MLGDVARVQFGAAVDRLAVALDDDRELHWLVGSGSPAVRPESARPGACQRWTPGRSTDRCDRLRPCRRTRRARLRQLWSTSASMPPSTAPVAVRTRPSPGPGRGAPIDSAADPPAAPPAAPAAAAGCAGRDLRRRHFGAGCGAGAAERASSAAGCRRRPGCGGGVSAIAARVAVVAPVCRRRRSRARAPAAR